MPGQDFVHSLVGTILDLPSFPLTPALGTVPSSCSGPPAQEVLEAPGWLRV